MGRQRRYIKNVRSAHTSFLRHKCHSAPFTGVAPRQSSHSRPITRPSGAPSSDKEGLFCVDFVAFLTVRCAHIFAFASHHPALRATLLR